MKCLRLAFLIFVVSANLEPARGQGAAGTGNEFKMHCQAALQSTGAGSFSEGYCLGTIATVQFLGNGGLFCTPQTSTLRQWVLVTLAHIDRNPQHLHEPLAALTISALKESFPCRS